MHIEKRDVSEMRERDECDMEQFCALDDTEKYIAILGDRWWPQKAKQKGDKICSTFNEMYAKHAMSARIFEVSTVATGTMLRPERDAWTTAK